MHGTAGRGGQRRYRPAQKYNIYAANGRKKGNMAYKEDVMAKIKRETPEAYYIMKTIDDIARKEGATGAVVTVTEDMTDEEQEMALFEGFLKEGYPPDVADQKAKQWLNLMNTIFKD